jgi:hypothetical protein
MLAFSGGVCTSEQQPHAGRPAGFLLLQNRVAPALVPPLSSALPVSQHHRITDRLARSFDFIATSVRRVISCPHR